MNGQMDEILVGGDAAPAQATKMKWTVVACGIVYENAYENKDDRGRMGLVFEE
jgi:hypothetical protein